MKKKKCYALPARYSTRRQLSRLTEELKKVSNAQSATEKLLERQSESSRYLAKQFLEENKSLRWQIKLIRDYEFSMLYEKTRCLLERKLRDTNQTVSHIDGEINTMKWSFPLLRRELTVSMIFMATVLFMTNAITTAALLWLMR